MATILIHMLHEPGHLNPTLPMARQLKERGHRVVYLSTLDCRQALLALGLECVVLWRDVQVRGITEQLVKLSEEDRQSLNGVLWSSMLEDQLDGRLAQLLEDLAPDLMLVDVISYASVFAAHGLGIPCLRLSTSLPQTLVPDLPPLTSALLPDAPPLALDEARRQSSLAAKWSGGGKVSLEDLSAAEAYPWSGVNLDAVFTPDLSLYRELVLCPPTFDLPRSHGPEVCYAGPSIDLERQEVLPEGLLEGLPAEGTVVYCSLGTQGHRYPIAVRFYQAVIDALAQRPGWHAVLAVGEVLRPHAFERVPANVRLVAHAPQLALLRRASLMVTHGGLGSIKEAVALGVPLVVFPQQFDQPGNGVRVVRHGLGVRGTDEDLTGPRMLALMDRVVEEPGFRASAATMRGSFLAFEARPRAVELIEAMLPAPPRGRRTPRSEPIPADATVPGWVFLPDSGRLPGGEVLRAGEETVAVGEPEVGGAGIPAWTGLLHALSRAQGALLCRVALSGDVHHWYGALAARRARCLGTLELSRALHGFGRRCAEVLLQECATERRSLAPELLAGLDLKERWLRGEVASAVVDDAFAAASKVAAERWLEPMYRAIATSLVRDPVRSGRGTFWLATRVLARFAVRTAGVRWGTPESAEVYRRAYARARALFQDELVALVLDEAARRDVTLPGLAGRAR